MKTKSILILAAMALIGVVVANNTDMLSSKKSQESSEIAFTASSFEEALAEAKLENKLIFIDAYATWCGPCKRLAKTTFKDASVADYFNSKFINVKMDVDTKEGKAFSTKYGVTSIPTLIFIDSNGKVKHKSVGLVNAESLLSSAKAIE